MRRLLHVAGVGGLSHLARNEQTSEILQGSTAYYYCHIPQKEYYFCLYCGKNMSIGISELEIITSGFPLLSFTIFKVANQYSNVYEQARKGMEMFVHRQLLFSLELLE